MGSRIESALRLHSRLRKIDESIDSEVMSHIVSVINSSESPIISINHLIHYICYHLLQNESKLNQNNNKDNEVSVPSQSSQEVLFVSSDESDEEVIEEQNEETDEETDEESDCINPLILIYDGLGAFDSLRFSQLLPDMNQLKDVNIYEDLSEDQLLMALNNDLRTHLAFNPKLKLIVIYANSCYTSPQIVDQINEILFSFEVICVHVILVTDRITKIQFTNYLRRPSFQIINCKPIGFTQIQIKNQRNGNIFRRDVLQNVQIV